MIKPAGEKFAERNERAAARRLAVDPIREGLPGSRPVLAREAIAQLVEVARARLQASSYYALRTVRCTVQERVLVLNGCVSSFYLKQLAQSLLMDLVVSAWIDRLDNQIEVRAE
jgi:hypothetical protein